MNNRVCNLERTVQVLEVENTQLKQNIKFLHNRFTAIEHHTYEANVEIKGIPQSVNENLINMLRVLPLN